MKKFIYTAIIALSTTFAFAQNKAEWKELKDFHTVMSQTFHPAEEGNLKPIRERSAEMVKAAEAWKKSAIPADYKNVKDIQETLNKLVDGSKNLDKQIKAKASDEEIKKSITALHDVFHTIVGLCRPGHDDHKGHGHDEHDGHKH
ncbi:MAG: hypothetical protein ACK5QU_07970 [Bacteroidota bacterium]